jgi:hypothetical protein
LQFQILKFLLHCIITILTIGAPKIPYTLPSILHPYSLTLALILGLGGLLLMLNAMLVVSLIAESPLKVFLHGPVTHILLEIWVPCPHLQSLKKLSQCSAVLKRLVYGKSNKLHNNMKIIYVILGHLGSLTHFISCDLD